MERNDLARYLDELLVVGKFKDYCPNGLQVEGRARIERIATGVTASVALIDRAVEWGADALLVHHGYFWRGEDGRIVGLRQARIARLIRADLNLFAFHLPLDAHPELGNNAQLARQIGLLAESYGGEQDLIVCGRTRSPMTLDALGRHVGDVLGRAPTVLGPLEREVTRVAWCSGGAQGYFEAAIGLGAHAYLTGEVSEQQFHLANESGVGLIAAGHHATERFGVRALGAHLAHQFGLVHADFDLPNPI